MYGYWPYSIYCGCRRWYHHLDYLRCPDGFKSRWKILASGFLELSSEATRVTLLRYSLRLYQSHFLTKGVQAFFFSSEILLKQGGESSCVHFGERGRRAIAKGTPEGATVEPSLTFASCKRTPPISGHQTVILAISPLKLYIFNLP